MSDEQSRLFEMPKAWEDHWAGMPEFRPAVMRPWQELILRFRNQEDRDAFASLIEQRITSDTYALWYPKMEINKRSVYAASSSYQPRYPIYIISKGRWESRLTVKALDVMNVPYRIVIEPQEFENYAAVIPTEKIFVLPFSNLGQGSIPARNWVWDHAQNSGAERHWILDDNISGFIRQDENRRFAVDSGVTICAMEDFVDRYENVALAGPNYRFFGVPSPSVPPFQVNTRVYSCILIKTALPYRWRGRYNEDTDLSLRVLKDGHCTVLFNAFKINKMQTMTMKGGNTDELYREEDSRLKMAESLREQHPDVVVVTRKWNRWQHHVDYRGFKKNHLVLRSDLASLDYPNEFGMTLKQINEDESVFADVLEEESVETSDSTATAAEAAPVERLDDASTTIVAQEEFRLTP